MALDAGAPTLSAQFAITANTAELDEIGPAMDRATASVTRDAALINRATSGMFNMAGPTIQLRALVGETTRAGRIQAAEALKVENAGERMLKQLERQTVAYGKTREELRALKTEEAALAAERVKNFDLAGRLRAGQAALVAKEDAAASAAAMKANAAAAERMRAATDPLYAATARLNAEIAESTRLYRAGATAPAEYARQQEVLTARLNGLAATHDNLATTTRRGSGAMTQFGFQLNDVATMAMAGAPLMQIFATQAGQIFQVAQMAEGGMRGFAAQLGGAALKFGPLIVVAAAAAGAIKLLQNVANDGAPMTAYARSLGLTADEIKKLDGVTVTFGDTAKAVFQVAGRAIWDNIGPALTSAWTDMKRGMGVLGAAVKTTVNFMIGGFVGAYTIITKQWQTFPAVLGDIFYTGVNAAIGAINQLLKSAVNGINMLARQANRVLPEAMQIPELSAPQISAVNNQYAGAFRKFGRTAKAEMTKAMGVDYIGNATRAVSGAISDQARKNAEARIKAQADALKDKRTGNTSKSPSESGGRGGATKPDVEADIRRQLALADAYAKSGEAAMLAEARIKAEADTSASRATLDIRISEQLRLAIAQRVVDTAKSTAAMFDQARAQALVTQQVREGLIPAAQAAEAMKRQMDELPLLTAHKAALALGDQKGAEAAKAAIDALMRQRAAREALTAAEREARFVEAMATGKQRLDETRAELALVGATDAARRRALTAIRAMNEAKAAGWGLGESAAYVAQQVQIADAQAQVQIATQATNDSLKHQAVLLDALTQNAGDAARGMAEAFGSAGRALGDMAAIFANHIRDQERMRAARDGQLAQVREIADVELRTRREQQIHAEYDLATMTRQVGVFGDLTAAARGFFKEGSAGYKAMTGALKVFRAIEFALSVKAMAQDAIETASKIAKSALRSAKYAVEAVVKAIASMPFPLNLAAGAATAAAVAALGIAVVKSFGGGGKKPEPANDGTGTVLGDSAAKSDSIKRSIDALKDVDTLMLSASREMAASLRSIDSQIGGFASVILRSGDINASTGVNEGFKANGLGSVLGAVPLIGGFLKSLFGTKTTVIGSGLYGSAQSLGDILSGGFDASTYSDIEKKKKFFGLTTGKKYSTQYAAADPGLENQFTLILRSFNDAILAAAGPLGAATGDIQARLNGFVVDIGKIDLKGLTGTQIEEKLSAVFGAAADRMAAGAIPGIERFQKAGEGAFETLVRVSSTVEAVTASLSRFGPAIDALSIDAKMALSAQFDSIGDLTGAAQGFFERYYSQAEQTAAQTARMATVFRDLGMVMPTTLAGFRSLVEAQDLNSAAGQATYATLLKLAPAFADLTAAMNGARSAADILAERGDLERKILELNGDKAALRALDLAKVDASNRALQEQVWAIEDAKEAARAADDLRKAWGDVGEGIADEVKRLRGLTGGGNSSFAAVMGQFNAANAAARGGDIDAAKTLTGLSQELIRVAEGSATSRQELDRVTAQTAAALEATQAMIARFTATSILTTGSGVSAVPAIDPGPSAPSGANEREAMAAAIADLKAEIAALRADNSAGHAATAGNTARIARKLDDVTAGSGGTAVSVTAAAA